MRANKINRCREIATVKNYLEKKDWCLGLALTGSCASDDKCWQKTGGDIDWLVIAQPNSLWRGRWQVSWWSFWLGKKRWPRQKEDRGWCFNLWLEANALKLPIKKRNLFSAAELYQAKWLIDKVGLEKKIWQENVWATRLLKQYGFAPKITLPALTACQLSVDLSQKSSFFSRTLNKPASKKNPIYRSLDPFLFFNLLLKSKKTPIYRSLGPYLSSHITSDWLNNFCYGLQRAWMKPRGQEIVNRHQAFFHPCSRGDEGWQVRLLAERAHREGKKVVLVTGVFDLLHSEHQAFLRAAKLSGDLLFVGIESDKRVRALKGEERPVWPERHRLRALQKIKGVVDGAWILPDNFGDPTVRAKWLIWLKPDILAASASSPHLQEKRAEIAKFGGQLVIVRPHNPQVSTTQILSRRRS